MSEQRARRLAERIQVIVAEMLERRIKDPRLGFVTVTGVRVTGDLREATVFYTVLGDPLEREASAAALEDRTESPTQQDPQHGRAAWSRPRTSHRNSTEPALAACQGLEWVEDKRSGCAKPRPHVLGRRCPSAAKALTRGPVLGSEYELVQLSEDVHCLVPQG